MKKRDSKLAWFAGASAVVMGLASGQAVAQETTDTDDTRRLSTVTVTATQRAESIQDVPIAITALDTEALDRAGITDVTNLQQLAPSFNSNSSDTTTGGTSLRIRGVGTTGNNVGLESSVGVFVDGVYLSRPGVALGDLLDVEQVEVLRGPQGTLFGRNTSAGALNIKTKKPVLDELEGWGNVTAGNFGLFNTQGGINIPVIEDKLAVRLSGAFRDRDGFVESSNGEDTSHDRNRFIVRGQAFLDLDQLGDIRFIADYSEANEDCCHAVYFQDTPFAAAFQGTQFAGDNGGVPVTNGLDSRTSNDTEFDNPFNSIGFSVEYNVDIGLGDLTYLGAYRDFDAESARSTDYTLLDIFTVGATDQARAIADGDNFAPDGNQTSIETQTHELRLQGTAFGDRLDWLVGAYYSDEQIEGIASLTLGDDYQEAVSAGIFGDTNNLLLTLAGGVDASGDFSTAEFGQDGESFSFFTHNILSLTDKLSVTAGVRYVDETKDGFLTQVDGEFDACLGTFNAVAAGAVPGALAGPAVALNCFVFAAPALNEANFGALFPAVSAGGPLAGLGGLLPQDFETTFSDDELVWTLKAGYDFTSDISIYGGFTHGFKSGGINLDASAAASGASPNFDSEEIDSWEVGLKGDFFDGRARANVAVFHSELSNFQVLEFTGIRFQTFNVDEALSTGVEIETEAQLNDYFTAGLSYTYANARYPSDCATFDSTDLAFNPNAANLCGNTLTNAPENVIVATGGYQNTIGEFDVFANASLRWEDDRRTSTQASEVPGAAQFALVTDPTDASIAFDTPLLPGDIQDANTKINLRVGLGNRDQGWGVEFWANNVTDEQTKNVTFNIPLRGGFGNRARGEFIQDPRTYGVTLRANF